MTSLRRVCALVLLLSLPALSEAAPAATGAARNLLPNPGFEQGSPGHEWMPANWDTFPSALPTVFFGRDTMLARSGRYAVHIANVSTYVPMFHNWSQSLTVGRELWGKDIAFSVWTRTTGLQGRAYVLLQAYRDTIGKMGRTWKVPREEARERLRIGKLDDPLVNLGWDREYFSENETDWVRREVRIFVPPSTNTLIVRCGIFGIGQVVFDDASLTAEPARSLPELPIRTNLLSDAGFENDGNDWEYSLPPYEGMVVERDTTVARNGKASIRMEGGLTGPMQVRTGVCQLIDNPNLSGKRFRLSGWLRTDSLEAQAYIKVYCTTLDGDVHEPTTGQFGATMDWTQTTMEVDAPPGTIMVWGWFLYNAPGRGRLYYDDCSLEILGPADYVTKGTPPPKAPLLPSR